MRALLRWFLICYTAGVLALSAVTILFVLEPGRLKVEQVELCLPHWPSGVEPARVVLLADLHAGVHSGPWVDAVVRRTLSLQPQAVILAGDYFNALSSSAAMPAAELAERLRPLAEHCPVYFVCGNHDGYTSATKGVRHELTVRGMHNIERAERVLTFPNGCRLCLRGAAYYREAALTSKGTTYARRVLQRRFSQEKMPRDMPLLAVSHNPYYFQTSPLWADFTVSGHTHGGQICLPNGYPLTAAEPWTRTLVRAGLKRTATGAPLYITRGLGLSRAPIRLFCPPEITLMLLRGSAESATQGR